MTRLRADYTTIPIDKKPRGRPRVISAEKLREMERILQKEGIKVRARGDGSSEAMRLDWSTLKSSHGWALWIFKKFDEKYVDETQILFS